LSCGRRVDADRVPIEIGTREELMTHLRAALKAGEPTRLLAVFRVGKFEEFVSRYGYAATGALMSHIASLLPEGSGPPSFYYRPRKNELCAIIGGHTEGVEGALAIAAREVDETLGESGVSLGFGTAILPFEASDPVDLLALADSRLTGVGSGQPMPREGADDGDRPPARVGVLRPSG
jgi:GGDEF domain-containing protein